MFSLQLRFTGWHPSCVRRPHGVNRVGYFLFVLVDASQVRVLLRARQSCVLPKLLKARFDVLCFRYPSIKLDQSA